MAFTDNFNGALEAAPLESWTPSGGTAWTRVDGVANGITVSAATSYASFNASVNTLYWCDSQGTANHYSQFATKAGVSLSFLANRATNSNNFIGTRIYSSATQLYKRVSGSLTLLGSFAGGRANDILRIESGSDNKHTVKVNGVQVLQATDAFNASEARQGLCSRDQVYTPFDDYEAGSLPSGTISINSILASNITQTGARITLGLTR